MQGKFPGYLIQRGYRLRQDFRRIGPEQNILGDQEHLFVIDTVEYPAAPDNFGSTHFHRFGGSPAGFHCAGGLERQKDFLFRKIRIAHFSDARESINPGPCAIHSEHQLGSPDSGHRMGGGKLQLLRIKEKVKLGKKKTLVMFTV